MTKSNLRTATKILREYIPAYLISDEKYLLKAMRHYSRLKSDIAYEKWFQTALKLYNLK